MKWRGVWHVQEMTGRRPEGEEDRRTVAWSTYTGICSRTKTPWSFNRHHLLPHHERPKPGPALRGLDVPAIIAGWSCSRYAVPPPSLLPGPYTCFFPSSFPSLSSPKGFPSASDYLWLQLFSRQPSGPGWRLRSLSPLQTALREGWMEGRRRGEQRGFTFS